MRTLLLSLSTLALLGQACQHSSPDDRTTTADPVVGTAGEATALAGDRALGATAMVNAGNGSDQVSQPGNGTTPTYQQDPATQQAKSSSDRDSWQRPDMLFALMDNNLQDLVIADLFADDGYFTWKMLERGAIVIAVVEDPAQAEALKREKKHRGYSDEQLQVRLVREGDPGLAPDEVQVALITHRYTTIKDRKDYFKRLREGIAYPRPTFIIDWLYEETPIGPPLSQRMRMEDVMDELGMFGYTDIGAHSKKMPYQVIYFTTDPIGDD